MKATLFILFLFVLCFGLNDSIRTNINDYTRNFDTIIEKVTIDQDTDKPFIATSINITFSVDDKPHKIKYIIGGCGTNVYKIKYKTVKIPEKYDWIEDK